MAPYETAPLNANRFPDLSRYEAHEIRSRLRTPKRVYGLALQLGVADRDLEEYWACCYYVREQMERGHVSNPGGLLRYVITKMPQEERSSRISAETRRAARRQMIDNLELWWRMETRDHKGDPLPMPTGAPWWGEIEPAPEPVAVIADDDLPF